MLANSSRSNNGNDLPSVGGFEQIDSQIEVLEQRQAPADTLRRIAQEQVKDAARADAIFGELMDATLHDSFDEAIDAARSGLEADAGRVSAIEAGRAREMVDSLIAAVEFVRSIEEGKQAANRRSDCGHTSRHHHQARRRGARGRITAGPQAAEAAVGRTQRGA